MEASAPELEIRVATSAAERERIYRFRYEVYVARLGRQARDADHRRRTLREDLDDDSTLIHATSNGAMVGVARSTVCTPALLATPLATSFALDRFRAHAPKRLMISSRLMVDPRWRSAHIGARVMAFMYERCRDLDALFDFCHCRPELVGFYEILGHRRYLAPFDHPEAGPLEPMVFALQDTIHLAHVGSPLLPLALARPHNDVGSGRWLAREIATGDAAPTRRRAVSGGD
jgi:GNAT superfamily N-acetyltransferase